VTDQNVQHGDESEETSSSLLERIKARSEEDWQQFVKLYCPIIYRWCQQKWGLQQADAEDVVQDVFQKVANSINSFAKDGEKASFRRWLKTIALNSLRDVIRRLPPGGKGVGGDDDPMKLLSAAEAFAVDDNDDSAVDDERELVRGVTETVLARCKEQNCLAFIQVVVEGKSPSEVAENLGVSANTVYLAVSHIKHRIKKALEGLLMTSDSV
jgi:RNA polymerase sigma factor (sigma-70 family)